MRFTGKNLLLVRAALESHRAEVWNMIVTAPELRDWSEACALEAYEQEHQHTLRLIADIDRRYPL